MTPRFHAPSRSALAALLAVALCVPLQADDDDLFSSKPVATPPAPAKPAAAPAAKPAPAVTVPLPAKVTATRVSATGVSATGTLETWQIPNYTAYLPTTSEVQGRYVLGSERGELLSSVDGVTWDTLQLAEKQPVQQVLHDGKTWVVRTAGTAPFLYLSPDGKSWTPNREWTQNLSRIAVRNGQFWSTSSENSQVRALRVELNSAKNRTLRIWDGKLEPWNGAKIFLQSRSHLFVAMSDGRFYSSDNGEWWNSEMGAALHQDVDDAFIAEGNGTALFFTLKGLYFARSLALYRQDAAGAGWSPVDPAPFKDLRGVVYGGGRFVAVASTTGDLSRVWSIFESTDGKTWTKVGPADARTNGISYGTAGFVMGCSEGKYQVYRPAPLPEKPLFTRPGTPLPDLSLRNYGSTHVGSGKYRREVGPQTADQWRIKALTEVYSKAAKGDVAARRELAVEAIDGTYVERNPWMAERWLKEAMAAGEAQSFRGYAKLLEEWKPETPRKELFDLHRKGAERGDVQAMVWLADHLGDKDPSVKAERAAWAAKAAEKDLVFRSRETHRATYEENIAKAEAGDSGACNIVAGLLMEGKGVLKDEARAEQFLRASIAKKNAHALFMLADLHERRAGKADFKDPAVAAEYRKLLLEAAQADDFDALLRLANNQADGLRGFAKDESQAFLSYQKLAVKGHIPSMSIVGRALYLGGLPGVPKDEAKGEEWIRKAAAAKENSGVLMLAQIEKAKQRTASRPPLDGKVSGVSPEVFASLSRIQASTTAQFDDAALMDLFTAVWQDAEYSALDEDLAQELAAAKGPVVVTNAEGATLSYDKRVPQLSMGNFAQIFPVAFQPDNLNYYFTLWQRTAKAGLLVGAARVGKEAREAVKQGLAKGFFDVARQDQGTQTKATTAYFAKLKGSHDAVNPEIQKEFRALLREGLALGERGAAQAGNYKLGAFKKLPWLQETPPVPATPAAAPTVSPAPTPPAPAAATAPASTPVPAATKP